MNLTRKRKIERWKLFTLINGKGTMIKLNYFYEFQD